jgi:Tfp pilus assembly pilus retraction ATPase PilT
MGHRIAESVMVLADFEPIPRGDAQYSLAFIQTQQALVLGYDHADDQSLAIIGLGCDNPSLRRILITYHRRRGQACAFHHISVEDVEGHVNRRVLESSDFGEFASGPAEAAPGSIVGTAGDEADQGYQGNPAANLLRNLLSEAIFANARDMHLEKLAAGGRVRIRSGGRHVRVAALPQHLFAPLINHIKLRCDMDLLQTDVAQEGAFVYRCARGESAVRASLIPSHEGESISLRILSSANRITGLGDLGYSAPIIRRILRCVEGRSGLVLFTGPTGSGKTTSLHALIRHCSPESRKIICIEDPVEIPSPLVEQIEVNEQRDLGFREILKRVLRRSPEIIVVGEIRDPETASLAIRAALTGHTVLSTLHCARPEQSAVRLSSLGVRADLIEAALRCSVGLQLRGGPDGLKLEIRMIEGSAEPMGREVEYAHTV